MGAVANIFAAMNVNIVAMREHVDTIDSRFFLRVVADGDIDTELLQQRLTAALPADASIKINAGDEKKIAVLVTKEYHCLSDILVRNHFNTLGAVVQCVIGNHATLGEICKRFDVPFYLVPVDNADKPAFELPLMNVIEKYAADYIVLAKFMRILSAGFVEKYAYKIVNIHHSFLPAFVGASPYKQAYERGVKLIGATAHFVTNQLDEGPIIAQQIIPVTHSFTTGDMVRSGKEIETAVLARALQLVFEDRVLIHKNKTIVFE